jgi:hypothetical protein
MLSTARFKGQWVPGGGRLLALEAPTIHGSIVSLRSDGRSR